MKSPLGRLLTLASLGVAFALGAAGSALANPTVTITFDGAAFDPNPPPGLEGTPDLFEAGARYSGFWFDDAGTPGASHNVGHTHLQWNDVPNDNLPGSVADFPHSWRDGMQGVQISMLDGSAFNVVSIDFRIYDRLPYDGADPGSQFARLPWSYAWDDTQLLLSTSVDPVTPDFASFESQWTAFGIDYESEFDLGGGLTDPFRPAVNDPFQTIQVTGFENVTEFYLGHTASLVAIDNIVLELAAGGGVPEPGTGVLVGLGLGLLAGRRRRARQV